MHMHIYIYIYIQNTTSHFIMAPNTTAGGRGRAAAVHGVEPEPHGASDQEVKYNKTYETIIN